MKKVIEWIGMLGIFLFGFFLRAQESLSQNYLFLLDQGRDMLAVRNIVYYHHLTLLGPYTSLQGVFQGPLWYYLLSVPALLTHGDPGSEVVLMLMISLSVMLAAFLFMKRLFSLTTGMITLFLFAISPQAISAATFSWNPHPMWLMVVLFIFVFYVSFQENDVYFILLWPIVSMMFHFETAMAVFFLLATILSSILLRRKIKKYKNFWIGVGVGSIGFLPQIFFDLRHHFLMTRSLFSVLGGSSHGLFAKGENHNYFVLLYSHFQEFFSNFQGAFPFGEKIGIYLFLFFCFMTFLLFKKNFYNPIQKKFLSITISIGVGIIVLFSFFYPFPLRYWFITGFESFYLITAAVFFSRLWEKSAGKIIVCFVFLLFSFFGWQRLYALYMAPPNNGGSAKSFGKLQAIDAIYTDAHGKPFSLFVFTPPVATDAYDYLVWWYGQKRYHYIPGKSKKGVFYLLIEPDGNQPWTYQGWLQTVIKSGQVVYTKTLSTGFIIQKRIGS